MSTIKNDSRTDVGEVQALRDAAFAEWLRGGQWQKAMASTAEIARLAYDSAWESGYATGWVDARLAASPPVAHDLDELEFAEGRR